MGDKILRLYKSDKGFIFRPLMQENRIWDSHHLFLPKGIVKTKTILHTLEVTKLQPWTDREHTPPLDYGKDFIRHIQTEVDAYTFYCDSLPWDGKKETLDSSGDGTKENPWRNMSIALQYLQCLSDENILDCCNYYLKLIVSGVINYTIDLRTSDGYTIAFCGNNRVILDCAGVVWNMDADTPYGSANSGLNDWTRCLLYRTHIYNLNTTTQNGKHLALGCTMYNCTISRAVTTADAKSYALDYCIDCTITDSPSFYSIVYNAFNSKFYGVKSIDNAYMCSMIDVTSAKASYGCDIVMGGIGNNKHIWSNCTVKWSETATPPVNSTPDISLYTLVNCTATFVADKDRSCWFIDVDYAFASDFYGGLMVWADTAINCKVSTETHNFIPRTPCLKSNYAIACSVTLKCSTLGNPSNSYVGIEASGYSPVFENCTSDIIVTSYTDTQDTYVNIDLIAFNVYAGTILNDCQGSVTLSPDITEELKGHYIMNGCAFHSIDGNTGVILHNCIASGNFNNRHICIPKDICDSIITVDIECLI